MNRNYQQPMMNNFMIDPQQVEQNLARELQKRKLQQEAQQKVVQKFINESEEIKDLRKKFAIADLNQQRVQQMQEHKTRNIQQIMTESEIESQMFQKRQNELREEQIKAQKALDARIQNKRIQEYQMQEKEQQKEEAFQQYIKEKQDVQLVVDKLYQEDLDLLQEKYNKMKICQDAMEQSKREKSQKIQFEKAREKNENDLYLQFIKDKEILANQIKEKKDNENAQKQAIFRKLFEEELNRRKEQADFENLKSELYQAKFEQSQQKKEEEEIQKKLFVKQQLQQADLLSREFKKKQKESEIQIEKEFRYRMMEKFAEYEKLEQMTQQKRRMKELDHKREVERLWQQRLAIYREEKDKELQFELQQKELENYNQNLINQEKEKILKEMGQKYEGFIPKFTYKNQQERDMALRN